MTPDERPGKTNRLFTAQQDSVVVTIHKQLEHLGKILPIARALAVAPEQIAAFMETTFWASLRANEGRAVRFSATLMDAKDAQCATILTDSFPYDEEHIAKIAPALAPHEWLGVSMTTDPFTVWGFGQGSDVISHLSWRPHYGAAARRSNQRRARRARCSRAERRR